MDEMAAGSAGLRIEKVVSENRCPQMIRRMQGSTLDGGMIGWGLPDPSWRWAPDAAAGRDHPLPSVTTAT
jgi:hypothetical protein